MKCDVKKLLKKLRCFPIFVGTHIYFSRIVFTIDHTRFEIKIKLRHRPRLANYRLEDPRKSDGAGNFGPGAGYAACRGNIPNPANN
jgi:hypothetical protein